MTVSIDLFYSLKKYCKDKLKENESSFPFEIADRDEVTLSQLIDLLNIPHDEVGFATRNKVKFGWDDPIRDGDVIKLYPVIIAG